MIYAILIALIVGAASGFYGGWSWESGRWAAADLKRAEAEVKVKQLTDEKVAQANDQIKTNVDAFKAGEEKGRKMAATATGRAQSDRQQFAVFADQRCVMPPQSLALLVAALKGVRNGVTVPAAVEAAAPVAPSPSTPSAAPPAVAAPPSGRPPKPVPKKAAP